jgi:hypothetical protein
VCKGQKATEHDEVSYDEHAGASELYVVGTDTGRARTVTWPELGRGARVSIPVTIGMTWPPEGLVLFKDGTSPTLPL